MDSSNGNANYKLKAINEAIRNGSLTKEEICRRLTYAIAEEYKKERVERDTRFILACEKILYEMYRGKPYVSRREASKRRLLTRIDRRTENRAGSSFRTIWCTVVIACSLLVVLICTDVLLHRKWLNGTSTHDEQQYVIDGNEINSNIVAEGMAVMYDGIQSIYTSDINEVVNFLGYCPHLPSGGLAEWSMKEYSAIVTSTSRTVSATYTSNSAENDLLYSARYYSDIDSARNWVEQNKEGEIREINGKQVYFASNFENNLCIWSEEATCFTLFGPVAYEQLIEIISSIKEIGK